MNRKQEVILIYAILFIILGIISSIFYVYRYILPFVEFMTLVGVFIVVTVIDTLADN